MHTTAFLVLLCTLIAACLILRMQPDRMQHLASKNASGNLLEKIKAGWVQALWWEPWGVKLAALLGLAVFWFGKITDMQLLQQVDGHTWTGYALLGLCLLLYIITGYILSCRLGISTLGWKIRMKLFVFAVVPMISGW